MNSILRITDPIISDDSIDKYKHVEYNPVAGANLNSGDIRINIETQDIFTHPSESFLLIEGQLIKDDDTPYANADVITLINNGMMYLFKNIKYQLSGQDIENVLHPGQATTMLGLLKYPDDFSKSQGLNQLWYKDTTDAADLVNNVGFKIRDDKKAIINMKNEDNKCFLWCALRALNPKDNHPERLDKKLKEKENTLNMKGIEYPVSLNDIDKFEKQNPTISITVFGYEGKSVYPLRISNNTDREHIILMLIEKDGIKHYCLVKNQSRLLSSQLSKHHGKKYFCNRYLNSFGREEVLDKHLEYYSKHEAVKIELPDEGTMLKFKDYLRSEKVPFIVYADFECFIKPIHSCSQEKNNDDGKSYTNKYQKHGPSSFCYYIKCFDDEVYPPKLVSYTGEDSSQKFVEMLENDIREIANIPPKKMILGEKEKDQFNKETVCWICKEEFNNIADKNGYKRNEKS